MNRILEVLTRRKTLSASNLESTQLSRVLDTKDLTALGVGSTLGVGVYVLAGHVARDTAGPAVVLSFLIAAVASVFAGLCYAEFGARTPRAGSAYIYSYVCVGEFVAFVVGWNLILEYVIGSASVARGLSLYLDTLLNNTLENTFREIAPIHIPFLSDYFDFFAFGLATFLSLVLAFGVKESSLVNSIFTILNIAVVVFVVIAGAIKADGKNWNLTPTSPNSTVNPPTHQGKGGFFPFGIEGMIKGAATCFYGFVGFDCIATTGEEVRNPQKSIPVAIVVSLLIIFLAYFSTSTVITLMVPYYLQDRDAPIPHAFEMVGWTGAKWVVAIGGIFGLCASLFGAMFPLPRIIYAMASDGLIFRVLGRISDRFRTPVIGTLLAGLLTGSMAALFDLKQLVNMMSIGTLLAYTIVAASVLLLRYSETTHLSDPALSTDLMAAGLPIEPSATPATRTQIAKQIFNCEPCEEPTKLSQAIVTVNIWIYCGLCLALVLCIMYMSPLVVKQNIWAIISTLFVVILTISVVISIGRQPQSKQQLYFKVPLVPLIPALSIFVNIYLMLMLDAHTWIRFAVWMAIGLSVYGFYGLPNSIKQHRQFYERIQ